MVILLRMLAVAAARQRRGVVLPARVDGVNQNGSVVVMGE
jgi:hypothetical protein